MGETFDQTRARIAPVFRHVPHEIKAARLMLTEAKQSVAVAALKAGALEAMAKHYSSRVRPRE